MTNKLLLILGVFFVGSLGKEICGPESCSDLEVAKSCNTVQDCIDNVWSHMKPTGDRDNICEICMKMVTEAREQLESNETKEELREVLEGSCKLLLVKPAVKMCSKLADEFVPELVAMLASQMDPEVVCSVAKLCNNAELRAALTESDCSSCQNFASTLSSFMNSISEVKFKDEALTACRSMGSFSDACFYYASMSSKLFFNQTKLVLKRKPCEFVDMCPKNYVVKTDEKEKSKTPWILAQKKLCLLCPEISSVISRKIKSCKNPEMFKEKALELCEKLTVSQDECKQEVERYYSTIYYWFKQDVDVSFLCRGLMCRSGGVVAYPVWPLLPASTPEKKEPALVSVSVAKDSSNVRVMNKGHKLTLSEGDPVDASLFTLPLERFAVQMNGGKENVCKGVFDALAANAADEDYVRQVLAPVCSDMDDTDKCRDFLNAHSRRLSSIFTKREIPEMICPELSKQDSGSTNEVCNVCVKAFEKLNEGLKNDAFKGKFGGIVGSVCDTVPEDSRQMCHSFIDTFMQKTLSSVSSGNETKTCAFLKLCESPLDIPVIPSPVVSEMGKLKNEGCQICLMVTQTVIDELTDKSSEDEIRKILMGVCDKLPSGVKKACDNVVKEYADELIDLIAHGLSPNEICTKLRFCKTSSTPTEVVTVSQNKESVENSKVPCNFCLTAMKMLINWVQNNNTEEAIRHYITQVCNYMPEETRDTCQNLIEQYADDIIDMLVADFNATEVCIFLKICGPRSYEKTESTVSLKSFDVGTNEVRDTYSTEGVCEFCRKVENSRAIKGNEESAAETLMALLMEVCVLNVGNLNLNCEKMVTEKVLPFGADAVLSMSDVCESFNICPKRKRQEDIDKKLIMRIHSAVEECAMCEAIVDIILNHKDMMSKHYNFARNASLACSSVPRNRESMCESMLVSYGPSIVNLLVDMNVKPDYVCFHVKLCDESQQTKVNMPVTDIEQGGIKTRPDLSDCKKGPAYWCSSAETARKCGTYPHCQEMIWKDGVPPK